MNLIDKIRMIADGEFEVCSKLSADEITQICRDLRGVKSLLDWTTQSLDDTKSELDEVSKRYTAMVIQNQAIAADNERLTEELIRARADLSGIKKQEPVYLWKEIGETDWMECHKEWYWKCLDSPEHDTMLLYAHSQ